MLIITECRTCNADKATCPIKIGLREKLSKAGIKDRLKYKCNEWSKHLLYKDGDKVTFHFIERCDDSYGGWQLSGETLAGVIIGVSKNKPVYQVQIDKENRNKIDPEYSNYDKYVTPVDFFEEDPTTFEVPVREEYITGIAD